MLDSADTERFVAALCAQVWAATPERRKRLVDHLTALLLECRRLHLLDDQSLNQIYSTHIRALVDPDVSPPPPKIAVDRSRLLARPFRPLAVVALDLDLVEVYVVSAEMYRSSLIVHWIVSPLIVDPSELGMLGDSPLVLRERISGRVIDAEISRTSSFAEALHGETMWPVDRWPLDGELSVRRDDSFSAPVRFDPDA